MEFITLPQLARDLNISERKIRRRLRRLITTGKLVETRDFTREDYQDEFHFVYMVDPQRFILEARLQEEAEKALRDRSQKMFVGAPSPKTGSQVATTGDQNGSETAATGQPSGSHSAANVLPPGTDLVTKEEKLIAWLIGQVEEKNKELQEWRGLLPAYNNTVEKLLAAKDELRRLGPGEPQENLQQEKTPEPDVINVPPSEEVPGRGIASPGSEDEGKATINESEIVTSYEVAKPANESN